MSKIRIFKKQDGSVIYNDLSHVQADYENWPLPKGVEDLEYILIDKADAPESNSNNNNWHEMIYFDGPCTLANLKQDKEWDVQLMPVPLILSEGFNYFSNEIDLELEKPQPGFLKLTQCQSEINRLHKCIRKMGEGGELKKKEALIDIYKFSLERLDEKVNNGKPDKPLVRNKLNAKITQLKG